MSGLVWFGLAWLGRAQGLKTHITTCICTDWVAPVPLQFGVGKELLVKATYDEEETAELL